MYLKKFHVVCHKNIHTQRHKETCTDKYENDGISICYLGWEGDGIVQEILEISAVLDEWDTYFRFLFNL